MKTLMTAAVAAALAMGALSGPAAARGDGGAEQRAKLAAEREKARSGDTGTSFLDRLFGTQMEVAGDEGTASQTTN